MKIEKISDNQIRCTLTHADLVERQLHLSELAYGSEKARSLFHDMMQQAAYEFGFEAEDLPLMIEAIPTSSGSIVLIITKVEDPNELDSRFSKFAPSLSGDAKSTDNKLDGAESLLNLLGKVKEKIDAVEAAQKEQAKQANSALHNSEDEEKKDGLCLFSFTTMEHVLLASRLLDGIYYGSNTLYKDKEENLFLLAMSQSDHTTNEFNRICNMLTEYGTQEMTSNTALAFLEEHCELYLSGNAMQELSTI